MERQAKVFRKNLANHGTINNGAVAKAKVPPRMRVSRKCHSEVKNLSQSQAIITPEPSCSVL